MRTRRAVAVIAVVVVVGCGGDDIEPAETGTPPTTMTATTVTSVPAGIQVAAGLNDPEDPNIVVLEFMPSEVSVPVGAPVEWVWSGPEPHSVTFLPPGREPFPGGVEDLSLFTPVPPVGPLDGQSLVNTGLRAGPDPFEVSFSAPGDYAYSCVIHSRMSGTVHVVADASAADTPEAVFDRRNEEQADWLAEGRAAKADFVARPADSTSNDDGTTTYDMEMGVTTEHTDVLAFSPNPAEVRAGDSVRFVNNSQAPHTASFFGAGAPVVSDPNDPRTNEPAPGPSPQRLSSTGYHNTGRLESILPVDEPPPESARSFTFELTEAGTFSYVCIFHAPMGMVGTIDVR